jgi:TonB family protein
VPRYPSIARSAKVSGTVNIDLMVAEDGKVISAKAIDGHPLLRSMAEVSAREWRFAPAKNNFGMRAIRLTFTFLLLPPGTPESDLQPIFMTPYHVEIRQMPNEGISDPAPVLTPIRKKKSLARKPKCKSRGHSE